MNAKELAAVLNGREYGMEITKEEERQAADARLVVVYGYSDDNVELRGAIDEEVGAYNGTTIYVDKDGLMYEPPCGGVGCRYYDKAREACETIDAVWCGGNVPWTFETDIPHETFTIFEDGEPFCVGIMFQLADVAPNPPSDPLTLTELREMDGEPVCVDFDGGGEYVLVRVLHGEVSLRHKNGILSPAKFVFEFGGRIYRRKPEEGTNHV